jgi:hypothetical protein
MNDVVDESVRNDEIELCDLCIVGAGIAGMNALFAAVQYLAADARVILIDRNPQIGGMWVDTYDYVRLHQPHRMFTAGNIPWELDQTPSYLASKEEVIAHFTTCIEQLRTRVNLVERYGYTYVEHRETPLNDGYEVHIECVDESTQKPLLIKAEKCVKAFGFRVPKNKPLSFASTNVRSISPHNSEMLSDEMTQSDEPIYVIGGGKTGMDTVHSLVTRYPHKHVNLIAGAGCVFASRDVSFPTGLGRWWGGQTTLEYFAELCSRYDGDNTEEILHDFKQNRAVYLHDSCKQYGFGVLSAQENETISKGINELFMDYLSDITEVNGETTMVFRSGDTRKVEPNSWLINCTGYIMREEHPYEPFLSPHGAVVSIQASSGIHFLTTYAAYFTVHLFYLNKIRELPLYEINYQALLRKDKVAFPFIAMTQVLYNIIHIMNAVPAKVMSDCGLDFERWFPIHRRIFGVLKLKLRGHKYVKHYRNTLDTIARKYDVNCGVLKDIN